jgi:acetolactate synthase-1/2/3 large subunit
MVTDRSRSLSGLSQGHAATPQQAVHALLDLLEQAGVNHVFGVPGAAITPFYEALAGRARVRHVLARHEEGAALMAYGYARVQRALGVCLVTTGPGATNALTGIAAAQADSAPVLLLSGQVSRQTSGRAPLQELDLVQIYRAVTKLSAMPASAARLVPLAQRAIRTAMSGRPGPVHLNIPTDMLKEPVHVAPARGADRLGAVFDPAAVARAADLIAHAKCPVLLAGSGVDVAGAWDELFELATRWSIRVATTPKAKGVFPENHPLALGVVGLAGHRRAERHLLESSPDVLIIVGTTLGEFATNNWDARLGQAGSIVQVDIDPTELGKNYPIDVGVQGDARLVLQEISADLQQRFSKPEPRLVALSTPPEPQKRWSPNASGPERLNPQFVIQTLRDELADDALLFVDNGNCMLWAGHFFEARRAHTYMSTLGLASMGTAVAAAIGGKLAAPNQQVVSLTGDGAFAMNGMEVHSAVEHDIPVVWVVLNDGGLGMVRHGETLIYGHDLGACRYEKELDFCSFALALGARGYTVERSEQLAATLRDALACGKPAVVDVKIDPAVVPPPLARRAAAVLSAFGTKE